ncbi:MAG TPA: hypothetical protein VIW24_00260 [Aldersonia sp.]
MSAPEQAGHGPAVAGDLVADAAEAIREKIDQWLDRVVDRILAAPAPGTAAWQRAWRDRATPTGRAAERRRLLTRIAVAQRAGIDPTPPTSAGHSPPASPHATSPPRTARRAGLDERHV